MSDVRVEEPHHLDPNEAKARVASFEEMMKKYGVAATWNGLQAKLKGTGVQGTIEVDESLVRVHLKLGMLARAAGVDPARLEGSIRKRIKAALDA